MVKFGITTVVILIALFVVPIMIVNDAEAITQEEIDCIKSETRLLFDNPIEKIVIQGIEVEKKENNKSIVNIYTFGGLKYAIAKVGCNKGAHVVWRRWFAK